MICSGNCQFCKVSKSLNYETPAETVTVAEEQPVAEITERQADEGSRVLEVITEPIEAEPIEYSVKKMFGKKLVGVRK